MFIYEWYNPCIPSEHARCMIHLKELFFLNNCINLTDKKNHLWNVYKLELLPAIKQYLQFPNSVNRLNHPLHVYTTILRPFNYIPFIHSIASYTPNANWIFIQYNSQQQKLIGSAHGINNLANPIILIKAKGNLISSDFQSIELKLQH